MTTELSLLTINQLQKLAQQKPNLAMWSWNDNQDHSDDSWEVRAFANDTSSATGTTWPPRSYSCSFCHREFRSAQALGGHMNVHRRDRAKLREAPESSLKATRGTLHHPQMNFSAPPELGISSGSLCLLYPMPPSYHGDGLAIPLYKFMVPQEIKVGDDMKTENNVGVFGGQEGGDDGSQRMEEELDLELRLGRWNS
ncbi:hypothetical protein J5N97_025100 [Dioscorea zingiberensis]|uniref:C2H2-type domain-containing protein n=1 Tax=Dioscorea zingiberensis TaxID=325984 RepID=A0A9D5C8C6_9LILI|nr:hypothetical protein J5N97_025100 [Dioscorea zingiberensis]